MAGSTLNSRGAVCIPMNVDAFILNPGVCNSGSARIAPITQPDYLGLRPVNSQVRADILPHVDVSDSQPASRNPRISEVEALNTTSLDPSQPGSDATATPPLRNNRIGAYVHWSLPRLYRAATSSAEGTHPSDESKLRVRNENTCPSPTFRPVPNRWYVTRIISSSVPQAPFSEMIKGWVIESDRLWTVDELGPEVDLETDVSPYVAYRYGDESSPDALNNQAGVYIGSKTPVESWHETRNLVPRVPLTVMNSSNFCFADNTMHNPNVFSMIDNFEYMDEAGTKTYFESATCHYVVIGWHSSEVDDPLGAKTGVRGTLYNRLKALFCTVGQVMEEKLWRYLQLQDAFRVVCHGTIYNVQFSRDIKPATPADRFGDLFTSNVQMEPLAVGTTGLDAVLSFLEAHRDNEDSIFGPGTASIANEVLSLSELLYATEESYDSRIKASDLMDAHNFGPSSGGNIWHYDGKAGVGGAPARPSVTVNDDSDMSEADFLDKINDLQYQLDTAKRKLQYHKWSLFAVWWEFVSDANNKDPVRQQLYQARVAQLRLQVQSLVKLISDQHTGLVDQIEFIVPKIRDGGPVFPPKVAARSIPQPSFFQRRDPTLCIAGMDSGWPTAYLGVVMVTIMFNSDSTHLPFANEVDDLIVAQAIQFLFDSATQTEDHNLDLGYKQWDGQPCCPLYVEWEATYFHIPFEKWSVDLLSSPVGHKYPRVRYGVKDILADDPQNAADQREVSGRIILLPQPAVNLQALVKQVINDPKVTLTEDERTELLDNIGKLKFACSELSGTTTNLLTLLDGSHVQPNMRVPGEIENRPLAAAVAASLEAGLTVDDFVLMGAETALTPYGTLFDFSRSEFSPFKGVTHGQLRFSKINIVDKFGQVISALPPKPALRERGQLFDTVYPCLGDQVCPDIIKSTEEEDTFYLNTVTPLTDADPQLPGDYPLCPYVQLTPAINQASRLNASFVIASTSNEGLFTRWRATSDWEQPVWAWVIVNYADYGLQFFNGDGTFYVEMTLGGPTNTIASPKWLPFDPPSNPSNLVSPQLQELIAKMTAFDTGGAYLRGFWEMINKAVESMPFVPADYASYATSIIGKPFALVNAGFSLELDLPPLQSKTSTPANTNISGSSEAEILFNYRFPLKIGDKDRPYDGVVGFFDTENSLGNSTTHWDTLHTYFVPPTTTQQEVGDPREEILPANFPTLSPYYVEPEGPLGSLTFTEVHAEKLMVKTFLMDPYTPMHAYSPILPIKSLQLPAWTVQEAMRTISAFFRLGPVLVTRDVPSVFDAEHPLSADTWTQQQRDMIANEDTAPVRLPIHGTQKGLWSWLQPYAVVDPEDAADNSNASSRKYNALEVGEDDGRIRLDPAPYTMIEGFLQLTQPLNTAST